MAASVRQAADGRQESDPSTRRPKVLPTSSAAQSPVVGGVALPQSPPPARSHTRSRTRSPARPPTPSRAPVSDGRAAAEAHGGGTAIPQDEEQENARPGSHISQAIPLTIRGLEEAQREIAEEEKILTQLSAEIVTVDDAERFERIEEEIERRETSILGLYNNLLESGELEADVRANIRQRLQAFKASRGLQ